MREASFSGRKAERFSEELYMISDFTVLGTKSEPCVSLSYLSMVRFAAQNSDRWNMRYPNKASFDKKHLKLDIIENDPVNDLLAGMAMGMLIQIYDHNPTLFIPEVSFCGISIKDKYRQDNPHTDHENDKDYIKVLGLLNNDWECDVDGGEFLYEDKKIPLSPGQFVVFNPRKVHRSADIISDKKRFGIDFTVKRKK